MITLALLMQYLPIVTLKETFLKAFEYHSLEKRFVGGVCVPVSPFGGCFVPSKTTRHPHL